MRTEILVIRKKDRFSSILIEHGFSVINFPVIKTEPLEDLSELESCLAEIESFDGIFITSSSAAEIVLAKFGGVRNFAGKFFVLGKRSDDLLKKVGFMTFFSEQATTAEELLEIIPEIELKGKKFLFPCGNRSLRVIPERLKNIAEVREVVVYKTVLMPDIEIQSDEISEKLQRREISAICFFSPSGVEGFLEKFAGFLQENIRITAIGKTTADFAKEKQLRVDFISTKPTANDFAFELTNYLRKESFE